MRLKDVDNLTFERNNVYESPKFKSGQRKNVRLSSQLNEYFIILYIYNEIEFFQVFSNPKF
jgi:hypothetical protein